MPNGEANHHKLNKQAACRTFAAQVLISQDVAQAFCILLQQHIRILR